LQSLAEGGGICISGTVYDQVKSKLGLEYEHLGEQTVKNIAEPVRVYRVLSFPGAAAYRVVQAKSAVVTRYRRVGLAIAVVLLIGLGSILTWHFFLHPPPVEVASKEKMAFPLPDKPSIAVLPFVNMSEDPKQEYFSDGITEEIITALSKLPSLFVIARNSTFTYKGKAVKVKQVAEELGIRYVLEGSVRKAGEKVRVSAQLIDALSGRHLWAERYDRDLKDIFALQDEITLKITSALQVKLTAGEAARLAAKGTTNLEAYLKYMQWRDQASRITKEGNAAARKLAEEIIALDPKYPKGYLALGITHSSDIALGLSASPQQSIARAIELAKKAISLDDSYSFAHSVLGSFYVFARQYDKAVAEAERAVALEPNFSESLNYLAFGLCFAGRPEEAIPLVEGAERLNPIPLAYQLSWMSLAYRLTGRYEKAIEAAKRAIRVEPNNQHAHINLLVSYIALGHENEARAEAAELLRIDPNFSVDQFVKRTPYKNQAENDRLADALYKAGLK
jgi:adenylate cyclase